MGLLVKRLMDCQPPKTLAKWLFMGSTQTREKLKLQPRDSTSDSCHGYLASLAHLNPRSINAVFGSKWVRLAARKTTLSES